MGVALSGTAPLVPVSDLEASITFYTKTLGFTLRIRNEEARYALFERDGALVATGETKSPASLKATGEEIAAQVWMADVDAYWAEISPAATALPEGRCTPPHDRDYGVREIHVRDPDGFLIFFTQPLA